MGRLKELPQFVKGLRKNWGLPESEVHAFMKSQLKDYIKNATVEDTNGFGEGI